MTKIILNKLSGEDKKARVGKMLIKTGDAIKPGDGLFHAESAKGNFLVKSEYEGIVKVILISEGAEVRLGQEIAEIDGAKAVAGASAAKDFSYHFGIATPKKEFLECDVAILGGGPGGYVAAIRAAQLGGTVVLIEKGNIGGTCLNAGCIPTKSFVKTAHLLDDFHRCQEFGILAEPPRVDLRKVVERKDSVVATLGGGIRYLLDKWQVRLLEGEGTVDGQGVARVKTNRLDAEIKARNLILATGSVPAILPLPGADMPGVLTSQEALLMTDLPKSMVIIGGGVIGMEFAMIFNSFGCKVTVVEYLDRILNNFDEDLIEVIEDACKEKGIPLISSAKVDEIASAQDGQMIVTYSKDGERSYCIGEKVLMAVGRKAAIPEDAICNLGLELNEKKNGIKVDAGMRTNKPGVYAIGDVTNIIQLAHVASHQGSVAAENAMGHPAEMDYSTIPSAVFLSPEIGTVGLCEKEADAKGIPCQITKFPFSANGKALSQGESKGFVKVLSDPETRTILGAAVVGSGATDLIAHFAPLILEKTDYCRLHHMVIAHPTTAESIHEVLLGIDGEAIHFA